MSVPAETYCPWCDKDTICCSDPPACIMGEEACSDAHAMWNARNKIADLQAQLDEANENIRDVIREIKLGQTDVRMIQHSLELLVKGDKEQ